MPYHDFEKETQKCRATGLAFDNSIHVVKVSPSLRAVANELWEDVGKEDYLAADFISYLGHLPSQGVLLINSALTVEPGKPGSHTHIWQTFTKLIFEALSKKDDLIYILWGNHSKSFKQNISNSTAHFIEGGHPSPLNTSLTSPFKGGKYFSKCNTILISLALIPIQW